LYLYLQYFQKVFYSTLHVSSRIAVRRVCELLYSVYFTYFTDTSRGLVQYTDPSNTHVLQWHMIRLIVQVSRQISQDKHTTN